MQIKIDNHLARKSNSLLTLNEIMRHPISRTKLASKLNLTMGGLTPIIKNMISSGLIEEFKDLTSLTLGRKPQLLKINEKKFKMISISISRDKYVISLVSFGNKILEKKEIYYQNTFFYQEDLLKNISDNIDSIRSKYDVVGISVISPGPLDYENKIILNPPNFNGWSNLSIKDILSNDNIPLYLEHDVDAIAYAENYIGSAENINKFISINIDQGVGCGIFIDNKNFRKKNRNSCEIGHMSVNIFGERCACGNVGCLEKYINTNVIIDKISKEKNKHVNWIEICSLYKNKDSVTLKIINEVVKILGNALISLLNILDLDLIILNGPLVSFGDSIPLELENIISSHIIFKNKNIKVINSKLQDSKIIGSSIIFFEEFLQNNDLFR